MFKRIVLSDAFRRRVSWIIAAVLIIPFAVFFRSTGQSLAHGPGGTAGKIFGKPVAWETFQEQQHLLRQQLESQFAQIPDTLAGSILAQYTWEKLMLIEEAKRKGVRISNGEIAAFIQKIPAFQQHGRFIPERYYRYLQAIGANPESFERSLRNDLAVQKLVDSVKASVSISDADVRTAYFTTHERLQAAVIVFDAASFLDRASAKVTEDALHQYYDAHINEVRIPDQLVIDYAGVSREELASKVQLSDEDLTAYYRDHQDQFTKEDGTTRPLEEVREQVRQSALNERISKQLKALVLDLQEDLDAKLLFDEIVTVRALLQRSVGPFPAGNPWVADGPEPAVLQAVADLPEGKISEVIETQNGVYLARVTHRIPSRIPTFEEAQEQVRERWIKEQGRALAKQTADQLRFALEKQRAMGLRAEEALQSLGITATRPAPFTRTEPIDPIGYVPAINEAVFITPLGEFTPVLGTPNGFVILRSEDHLPADESRFVTEQTSFREQTLSQRQSERIRQWIEEVRSRAKLQDFVTTPLSP